MDSRIPKMIHYCWFGRNPLPPLAKKCIASWRKFCPDYEIVEWNEDNFDLDCCDFIREAYDLKKWAFVSDAARLFIILDQGGVYLDTDVELIAPLDSILESNAFFYGIETHTNVKKHTRTAMVATGLGFGAEKGNETVRAMLEEYTSIHFKEAFAEDVTPCPEKNSRALERFGFDRKNKMYRFAGGTVYPGEYFCPKEHMTGVEHFTKNTVSIHHYGGSWVTHRVRYWMQLNEKYSGYLPASVSHYLASYVSYNVFYGLIKGHWRLFKMLCSKVAKRLSLKKK